MKTLFFLLITMSSVLANAQSSYSWVISLNKQVLFKGNAAMVEPHAEVKASLLTNPQAIITIDFKDAQTDKAWKRTFYINDSNDQILQTYNLNSPAGKVTFKVADLKTHLQPGKAFYIYTTATPKDEKKAAVVRVRRILLCRLHWK